MPEYRLAFGPAALVQDFASDADAFDRAAHLAATQHACAEVGRPVRVFRLDLAGPVFLGTVEPQGDPH